MSASLTLDAPAKINLCLEVLGKRDDGYHEVRTVLQTVDLVDELTFETAKTLSLEVEPAGAAPVESNFVLHAARLLANAYGISDGARIRLLKRIPAAAGLGGGSSDAAAAFLGLSRLWQLDATLAELDRFAAQLGSDVPFFLRGGTALATGRGEQVSSLLAPLEEWAVLLLQGDPGEGKTARLYGLLRAERFTPDSNRTSVVVERLRAGQDIADALYNTFDLVAEAAYPAFTRQREAFLASGVNAILAGAGPSLVALAASAAEAAAAAEGLRHAGWDAVAVRLRGPR